MFKRFYNSNILTFFVSTLILIAGALVAFSGSSLLNLSTAEASTTCCWTCGCGTVTDSCGYTRNCGGCGSSYCDTSGDVYRYCSGGDVWGVYDYRNLYCSGNSCHSSWDYNSCGNRKLEECQSYEACSGGQCVCNKTCSSEGYECGPHNICGSITACGTCEQGLSCDIGNCEVVAPGLHITSDPEIVRKAEEATIEWHTENYADSCEVTGPDFYETGIAGSETTTVESQETYTLTCINHGKQFTESITIQIAPGYKEY